MVPEGIIDHLLRLLRSFKEPKGEGGKGEKEKKKVDS
jgi:hypothetical protein